jgi:hypothetical protein
MVAAEIVALRRMPDRREKVGFGLGVTLLARQQHRQQVARFRMGWRDGGDFFQPGARGGEIAAPVGIQGLGIAICRLNDQGGRHVSFPVSKCDLVLAMKTKFAAGHNYKKL